MTDLAQQEALDGKNVTWLEQVTDERYRCPWAMAQADAVAGRGGSRDNPDPPPAHMQRSEMMQEPSSLTDLKSVSPALEHYTTDTVLNGLWKRPQLSPRDRSIVTLSVLIARNQTVEMPFYSRLALDNGVKPAEISEIITHLAFYSGWANATAASAIVKPIFDERGIGIDQLPRADVALLPLNEVAEKQRAQTVEENFGAVAPGVVQYTTDVLFRDLWLRPGLAPRDRSLVTVSALVANGQVAQIPYHLNRAMDNGLTRDEASEMLTQLAFYAGLAKRLFGVASVQGRDFEASHVMTEASVGGD
ncbi:carboxymuconolactone decarboxylase family protein [Paraburkholderia youngii]|uniref:carboxymuconolactone decarboxylase family protein n=1 Tax=Paraburkholderia youngii TaxID=2782701 RepID=UPI003D1B4DC6